MAIPQSCQNMLIEQCTTVLFPGADSIGQKSTLFPDRKTKEDLFNLFFSNHLLERPLSLWPKLISYVPKTLARAGRKIRFRSLDPSDCKKKTARAPKKKNNKAQTKRIAPMSAVRVLSTWCVLTLHPNTQENTNCLQRFSPHETFQRFGCAAHL